MKLKRLILPLIICFMIIGGSRYLRDKSYEYNLDASIDKSGLFHNIAWGTSRDEVKKIFKKEIKIKPRVYQKEHLTMRARYYDSMKDVRADIVAFFDKNAGLKDVGIYIFENEGTGYDVDTLKDKYIKKLTEVYGSPSSEFDEHDYEWQTINGAVQLKVWDDEEKYNQIGIFYSSEYSKCTKGDRKGYFNSTSWGTSKDVFAERMEEKYGTYINQSEKVVDTEIKDYMNLKGIDASVTAFFDNGLYQVDCAYVIQNEAHYSVKEFKNIYITKFNYLYSKPTYEAYDQYRWETSEGTINMTVYNNAASGEPDVEISYSKKEERN